MPTVRPLDNDERDELNELCDQALICLMTMSQHVPDEWEADQVFQAVYTVVEALIEGADYPSPFDEPDDVAFALGSLFGEALAKASGWTWVHLSLDDGFDGYAIVPEDRSFALWPHHYLYGVLTHDEADNTVLLMADAIITGELPEAEADSLVLLG